MSITINGYEYNRFSRKLLYSQRTDSYYRGNADPLTKRLYEAFEKGKSEPPFLGISAVFALEDIFFVCACLYEDNGLERNLDKHLDWIPMKPKKAYPNLPLCRDSAQYHCQIYGCVLAVLAVQGDLPEKVQCFMQAAQQKVAKSQWAIDFNKARMSMLQALNDGDSPKFYDTDLRPTVVLHKVSYLAESHPNDLEHFLTPAGIRMVLSRIRDTEECKESIVVLQQAQRMSATADLTQDWDNFFAELREECERTGKIAQTPTQGGNDKKQSDSKQKQTAQLLLQLAEKDAKIAILKEHNNELAQREKKANDNCAAKDVTIEQLQQQLAEKDAEIARHKKEVEKLKSAENATNEKHSSNDAEIQRLKEEVEELKKRLETAGEEYVYQIIKKELEGSDDMDKDERKEKYKEMEILIGMEGVPEKAIKAIRALKRGGKRKQANSTTINNFNGNVGQVANNVEEQHIAKER